jgi:putative hemolysin
VQREDGSCLIDAQIPFEEFLDYFLILTPKRSALYGFNTLGSFALNILHKIPRACDTFQLQDYYFKIVDMDKSRIDKILFKNNTKLFTVPAL